MRYILLFFFAFLSVNVFSQGKTDSLAIVQLIIYDYKTMGTWNLKKHIENATERYLLIEKGEVLNLKMEGEYFKSNAHRKIDRKDFFDFRYVRINGNFAYAVYNLKSDILENGKLKTWTWIESVIVRKIKGTWKIELIHSTSIDKIEINKEIQQHTASQSHRYNPKIFPKEVWAFENILFFIFATATKKPGFHAGLFC